MKSILAIAVLIIAVSPVVLCQTASNRVDRKSKAEREVLRLENKRVQALLRDDTATLHRIYSDDYTVMSTIGLVKNKADVMQDFRSGNLKYESFTLDEVKVRVYGNTAVVTGLSTQKARDKDQDISGQFYFTRVYVKQSGWWTSLRRGSMRKKLVLLALAIAATHAQAQTSVSKYKDEVRKRTAIWNTAFAQRDISTLTSLFSEDAQLSSAGGKWKNRAECAQLFEALFKRRPDITWVNKPTKIEVNPVWKVAYETGDWKEAWTEPDGRAEIQGKYFAMWKLNEGVWYINAAIFTPQRCIGESKYCRPRESSARQ